MPKRAAITGASGFLGAAIASELISQGYQVTLLLRHESATDRLDALHSAERLIYSKLDDEQLISSLAQQHPDVIVHCSWRGVSGSDRNEAYQISDNIPSTILSVNLAALTGCSHWIGLGSQAEYGNQNRRLCEKAPTLPTTIYGKAKLAAGITALALCDANGLTGTWLRIFSTYGPGDSPNWFLPYVTQELLAHRTPKLTGCEQLWDYLFVDDFARAVKAIIDSKAAGVFNVGSGTTHPLKEMVELIRSNIPSRIEPLYGAVPYRIDQVMHLEADISRICLSTGWKPTVEISQGIKALVDFEQRRENGRPSHHDPKNRTGESE